MATLNDIPAALHLDRETLVSFCKRWSLAEVALFGSVLRDDFGPESDVDVLVRFLEGAERAVFDLVYMKQELEELFDRKVDLVVESALRNPFRRHAILTSKRNLYAA